jgi:WD40 repeat protein
MVAVGDEEGFIRLFDSKQESGPLVPHLVFKPHPTNAVMDICFSSDDMLLATGSGDQRSLIIDIRTQTATYTLHRHQTSVKQVRFMPGNEKVLATSSRDGTVCLWDMRVSGNNGNKPVWKMINVAQADQISHSIASGAASRDLPGRNESAGRRGELSITALQFLPEPRSHLILTATDASTCVKLWDIRARYSRTPTPISSTMQPDSHNQHRHFGINSLVLGSNGSRLYALSKDNTIYAYSTSHLVLGSAPELSSKPSKDRPSLTEKKGLGPLYGFRHVNFHPTTFYVKASIRKASADRPELLAVGSSDRCAVLFPTDETFLKRKSFDDEDVNQPHTETILSSPLPSSPFMRGNATFPRPGLRRASSFNIRMKDTIPIYDIGTPLVRGHSEEVTSVNWSADGELLTVGDDHGVRIWREDAEEAKSLRQSGEGEGRRWGCGWAEVDAEWDEDDE